MRERVVSLDVLRGVVMVLMAIDHVRVYSGVPAGGPEPGIFFTRWVTHFCAPVFVFLAGTSAYLSGQKSGDLGALSRHLLTRGLILVVLELTLIRFFWSFAMPSPGFVLAGVIWMLGWCMILMAALVHLPLTAIGALGIIIIVGQDAMRVLGDGPILQVLYHGGGIDLGPAHIEILYSIVPWIGVMAAGYAFGAIVRRPATDRDKAFLRIGLSATAAFVVLGAIAAFASSGPPLFVRFFNQRKYPASQLFLMMTLGPSIALLPFVQRARGAIVDMFATFGRVPMFYYLLHIPVIHVIALTVWYLRDGAIHPEWFVTAPYTAIPNGERWSLPLLYAVFAIAVAILSVPCSWFADVKARRRHGWLRYI